MICPSFSVSLAGLVIGDPDVPGRMAFDQVDRAAELNAAVEIDRLGHRMRVGLSPLCTAVGKSEGKLKPPRHIA